MQRIDMQPVHLPVPGPARQPLHRGLSLYRQHGSSDGGDMSNLVCSSPARLRMATNLQPCAGGGGCSWSEDLGSTLHRTGARRPTYSATSAHLTTDLCTVDPGATTRLFFSGAHLSPHDPPRLASQRDIRRAVCTSSSGQVTTWTHRGASRATGVVCLTLS